LWDSWGDDAITDDRTSGQYARADRIRPINHKAEYYQGDWTAEYAAVPAGPAGAGKVV
jgi:hypothetical protein